MGMWWGDGPDGWEWIWMAAMMVVVWLPLGLLALWALGQFGRPPADQAPRDGDRAGAIEPRTLARSAYARGEMSREQFLRVIEDLDRTEAAPPRSRSTH